MRDVCYQQRDDGLLLFVKLTPNARKDEVIGLMDGGSGPLIAAKVRAIPDKGKANKAIIALASAWLNVAKSGISLKSGSKSRLKTLFVKGNGDELVTTLKFALETLKKQV